MRADEDSPGAPRELPPPEFHAVPADGEHGEALVAEIADPATGLRATLRIERPSGAATALLSVEVQHERAGWARLVALDLRVPGHGRPLVRDRALHLRPVAGTAWLDRDASLEVRAGGRVLLVDGGVDGVIVNAAREAAEVRVELFSAEARPFHHDSRCALRWRAPNKRIADRARLRLPGDRDRAVVQLAVAAPDAPSLAIARYPEGRDAALVITDHADQSAPDELTALAFGRSDAIEPVGGFLGHHLALTKSLFFHGDEKRPQLEDPRVMAAAEALFGGGSEIVPHSATAAPDSRETTRAALEAFRHFQTVTWIDHQPETNCEAFINQGYRPSGPFRIADLLEANGYRYLWSADDARAGTLDLLARPMSERAPTLWPLGRFAPDDDGERRLFRSSWMFLETRRFLAALAPARLDQLARRRGLAVLHTYLETLHDRGTKFGQRNLLVRRPDGVVATDPRFEALLGDLERRQESGALWVTTLRDLGDHLRALESVAVRYLADGTAELRTTSVVHGATLLAPRGVTVLVNDLKPLTRRGSDGETVFFLDLVPDHPVRVELRADGGRVPLLGYFTATTESHASARNLP